KTDLAIAEYKEALRQNAALPRAQEALGDLYLKKKDIQSAETEYRNEMAANPYSFTLSCKITSLWIRAGHGGQSVLTLQRRTKVKPRLGCSDYELGRALIRKEKCAEAAKHLQAAIDLIPEYAPAYVVLGQVYNRLGENEKAEQAIKKAQSIRQSQLQQVQA